MIDASELRIGNKVYYQWGTNPEDYRVDTIVSVVEGAFQMHFPIPITEKILLATGFEKFADHGLIKCYAKDIDKDSQILISLGQQYPYIELPNFLQCQDKRLSGLHQLQNLFYSLTGAELSYNP